MYCGVPTTCPVCVRSAAVPAPAVNFANPKSITFATGSGAACSRPDPRAAGAPAPGAPANSTLPGFRSRWITPRRCAAWTARASPSNSRAAPRGAGHRGAPDPSFSARNLRLSEPPSSSSMARYGMGTPFGPTNVSAPNTCTICGCCTRARTSASNRNRCTSPGSAIAPARIILSATSRFSRRCRALYTTPMPPRPISASTSNPGTSGRPIGASTVRRPCTNVSASSASRPDGASGSSGVAETVGAAVSRSSRAWHAGQPSTCALTRAPVSRGSASSRNPASSASSGQVMVVVVLSGEPRRVRARRAVLPFPTSCGRGDRIGPDRAWLL